MTASTRLVGAAVTLASIAGIVALTLFDKDPTTLVTLVTPILGAAWVAGKLDAQNPTLARIDRNVNGALDARIRDAVSAVLDERDGLDPTKPVSFWPTNGDRPTS